MLKIDRAALNNVITKKEITKLSLITYMSLIYIAKEEYQVLSINNFSVYRLYKFMKAKMPWINKQSVYNSVDRLIELDLIYYSSYSNNIDKTLIFSDYWEGLLPSCPETGFKSPGFIKFHKIIFTKEFYNLSLRDMKFCLKLLSHLNSNKNKVFRYWLLNYKDELMKLCKVNRFYWIKKIINKMKAFFKITINNNGLYIFLLNKSSSEVFSGFKLIYDNREIKYIEKYLKNKSYPLDAIELKRICHALHKKSIDIINKVLDEYITRTSTVNNTISYIRAICERIESYA